jgi:uncharacterized protein YndB with AHSA1/START domain
MDMRISRMIRAPIADVFAFFDDPSSVIEFSPHAVRLEGMEVRPDGRRTYDVVMHSKTNDWMQTVEQVLRQPPTRLVTRGGSWTADRNRWLVTLTTDRRLSPHPAGTFASGVAGTTFAKVVSGIRAAAGS